MPLNHQQVNKKQKLIKNVSNLFFRIISLIRPETIIGIFLLVTIPLTLFQIPAFGFYAVFIVFTIGYFTERIIMKIWKHKPPINKSEKP